jgi:hypothetical protein
MNRVYGIRFGLLFYHELSSCDFCDSVGPTASINCLCNDVVVICKKCLEKIIQDFSKEEVEKY